jgi:hypothetical protein
MEAGVDWNHVHKAIRHVASGVFMGGAGSLYLYTCHILLFALVDSPRPLGKKIATCIFSSSVFGACALLIAPCFWRAGYSYQSIVYVRALVVVLVLVFGIGIGIGIAAFMNAMPCYAILCVALSARRYLV